MAPSRCTWNPDNPLLRHRPWAGWLGSLPSSSPAFYSCCFLSLPVFAAVTPFPSSPLLTHHLPWSCSSPPFKCVCQDELSDTNSMRITQSCGFVVILTISWLGLVGSKNTPGNHSQTRRNNVTVALYHISKTKQKYLSPGIWIPKMYKPLLQLWWKKFLHGCCRDLNKLLWSYATVSDVNELMSTLLKSCKTNLPFVSPFSTSELHSQTLKQLKYLSQSTKIGFLCLWRAGDIVVVFNSQLDSIKKHRWVCEADSRVVWREWKTRPEQAYLMGSGPDAHGLRSRRSENWKKEKDTLGLDLIFLCYHIWAKGLPHRGGMYIPSTHEQKWIPSSLAASWQVFCNSH